MRDASQQPRGVADELEELSAPDAGPKGTTTLRARRSPLADPQRQRALLGSIDLGEHRGTFDQAVQASAREGLCAGRVEILQLNLGSLCNMSCRHCHVDAGPDRWDQVMDGETVDHCLRLAERTGAETVDLTGGAPELNPSFRRLVDACVDRGLHVIVRCNLTVLLLHRFRDLPAWLAERGVEVVSSLPHFRRRSTDAQRGDGAFARSIEALLRLNRAGYGTGDPRRRLTLVANPVGAFLAGQQSSLELEWRRGLAEHHGVTFDSLIALNNMPIARYLEWLEASGNLKRYLELLVDAFNPATLAGLMCRNTLSVSWDGRVFDCDFNQMLDLESRREGRSLGRVRQLDPDRLVGRQIVTGRHCFGCTAGSGSSCGGALEP